MALDTIDPVVFGYSSVTLPSNTGLRVTLALFGQKKAPTAVSGGTAGPSLAEDKYKYSSAIICSS